MQDFLCLLCSLQTLKPYYFLLTLSPLNCAFLCYSLTRRIKLNWCAPPAPRWLLGSLMDSEEACNPYVSEHACSMEIRPQERICVAEALIRMHRITLPFPLLFVSPQNIISLFLLIFSLLPFILCSLCCFLSVYPSLFASEPR